MEDDDDMDSSDYQKNMIFISKINRRLEDIFPKEEFYLDYLFNEDEVRCVIYKMNDETYPAPKPVARFVFKNKRHKYITPYFLLLFFSFPFRRTFPTYNKIESCCSCQDDGDRG
jgi:hypothetical protein